MLVLSRRPAEKIVFPGTNITVQVIAVKGNRVRLGIEAPPQVTVLRAEVRNGEGGPSPEGMSKVPEAGQWVRWRQPRHAYAIGWADAYGPGPFEVVRVVDKSGQGIPAAVVLKTDLGDREVNTVWLDLEDDLGWQGYDQETLTALDG